MESIYLKNSQCYIYVKINSIWNCVKRSIKSTHINHVSSHSEWPSKITNCTWKTGKSSLFTFLSSFYHSWTHFQDLQIFSLFSLQTPQNVKLWYFPIYLINIWISQADGILVTAPDILIICGQWQTPFTAQVSAPVSSF